MVWDVEYCTNRPLNPHGPHSAVPDLDCPRIEAICEGVENWLCLECSETINLEYKLDDL